MLTSARWPFSKMSAIIVFLLVIPIVTAYDTDMLRRGNCAYAGKDGREAFGCDEGDEMIFGSRRADGVTPGIILSQSGGELENPPIYHPGSQAFAVRQYVSLKPPHSYWMEEQSPTTPPDSRNCLLCEHMDTGACNAMPSCVFCEETVTASCELTVPCLRCQVIKNPFFRCLPGEKYMDECNSCRCTDGHAGWCTNMHCEYSSLNIYAMKLSDAEYY